MVAVKEIMHGTTVVPSNFSVHEIAKIMESKGIGSVLIESDGEICGILTERDVLTKIVARASDPVRVKACEIMTPVMYTIDHNDTVIKASEIFTKYDIRRLPVTREGKIIGMITARDVARAMPFAVYTRISNGRVSGRNAYPEENHYPEF
jgi:CBS domain-containing protein